MYKPRSVPVSIILTIVTCGIYGLYWFICLTDETNAMVPAKDRTASGGMALLYTLVTCGIYGLFWSYKLGEKMDVINAANGGVAKNQAILFLILSVLGLGIINYALCQSDLNKYAV